jgi:hypothetical protein
LLVLIQKLQKLLRAACCVTALTSCSGSCDTSAKQWAGGQARQQQSARQACTCLQAGEQDLLTHSIAYHGSTHTKISSGSFKSTGTPCQTVEAASILHAQSAVHLAAEAAAAIPGCWKASRKASPQVMISVHTTSPGSPGSNRMP